MRRDRLTTKQAAEMLQMEVTTLQYLMRNKQIDIGYAIRKEGRKNYFYYIYQGKVKEEMKRLGIKEAE